MSIPLITGGLFVLILVFRFGMYILVAPSTLIFYGLALVNASKYTVSQTQWLGLAEIATGLASLLFIRYGLIFWIIGFGVFHIIYGIVLYSTFEMVPKSKPHKVMGIIMIPIIISIIFMSLYRDINPVFNSYFKDFFTDIDLGWIFFSLLGAFLLYTFIYPPRLVKKLLRLLAIGVIAYYFRGLINFDAKSTFIKSLTYLWIIQNIVLVLMTAFKNQMYIDAFSLTFLRIGVYYYLGFSILGLLLTVYKIYFKKDIWFLFRSNSFAIYVVLIFSCIFNWNMIVTRYNLKNSKEVDYSYLNEIGHETYPILWEKNFMKRSSKERSFLS